jgi:phytoene synthase
MRPHVAAIYAFARAADDFADEGDVAPDVRLARLTAWREGLHQAVEGRHDGDAAAGLVFRALAHTIRQHALPVVLFDDLISAFIQDVHVRRYATWVEVLDYCRRSANPVGRLVLRLAGTADAQADEWSDRVCTALQLANFWQDFAVDWRRGRLYLPIEEVERAGARVDDLERALMTAPWKKALACAVDRTEAMFEEGRPVCDVVDGRLRWELRATCLGGLRILEKLRASDYDAFRTRPSLGARDLPLLGLRALFWRRHGAAPYRVG